MFSSFLALLLKHELERRMREAGIKAEWADVVRDLGQLSETIVNLLGKRFRVRTQAQGVVVRIVRCMGVRLVAHLGGCRDRKHDPEPGHQLMWHGYDTLPKATLGHQIARDPYLEDAADQ